MIRVRFIRDKVWKQNGKLFRAGAIKVLSDEILDECLTDGSAVIYNPQAEAETIVEEVVQAQRKQKKKTK